jgi:hypothetical protein
MRKTHVFALLVLLTLLISCNSKWNWQAEPFAASIEDQAIINEDGRMIFFADPEINNYACFSYDNLEDLALNIRRVSRNKNVRYQLRKSEKRLSTAKDNTK